MGDARGRRRATAMLSATFVAISYNEASAQERATCSQVVQNQPRGQGAPVLLASFVSLEPIREVWIHDEAFAAASRLSMMRIMAKRTNAATVVA
jgi:hypothetical protein